MIFKGSLSIEGISLTVAEIEGTQVTVAIIPHTVKMTNLKSLKPGRSSEPGSGFDREVRGKNVGRPFRSAIAYGRTIGDEKDSRAEWASAADVDRVH